MWFFIFNKKNNFSYIINSNFFALNNLFLETLKKIKLNNS